MSDDSYKVNNPFVGIDGYQCFGCDPGNDIGLQLEFVKRGEKVEAIWKPDPRLQGYPGVVHGGIQATLADEIGGWFIYAVVGTAGVTRRLEVEYHASANVADGPFAVTAEADSITRKEARVRITIANGEGSVCATAVATYALFSEAVARKRLFFPGSEAFLPQ
jgi:uncharacterized protein (TIGR00369 family)